MIASLTHDGRGIADVAGKKVFVAGALSGETVRFMRRKIRRNYDEAELLDVLDASPDRVDARCAVYGVCGGCAMQHLSHAQQLDIKLGTLRDNLERIGRVTPERWLETVSGPQWHYRRRARLAVKDVRAKGRVLVGFRERHAPFVANMHRCEVLVNPVAGMLDALSELIGGLSVRSRLPQIEVAVADNAVALVFRVLDPLTADDESRLCGFAREQGCRVYVQPQGLDSVARLYPLEDDGPLFYTLDEFDVRIDFDPVGFVQVNAEINRSLVSLAVRLLEPQPESRVLDLYSGLGNFSLPLARRAGSVLGIDSDAMLIEAAAANARSNDLGNARFLQADLAAIDGSEPWLNESWDRVLLDPARSGAAEFMAHVERTAATRIVYVSCHPGTLARDAGQLVNTRGYRLEAAGIVDMFPHTAHVESIALFIK